MTKSWDLSEIVILDFETTGLSADNDRVIEIGGAIVEDGKITNVISELLNPGDFIPYQITQITGINDEMVNGKPSPEELMPSLYDFIGERPILAHNAPFDRKFLTAEMRRCGIEIANPFLCSLALSRRLIPEAPNHRLGTLADVLGLQVGHAHRALDDVRTTAQLWNQLVDRIRSFHQDELTLEFLESLSKTPKARVRDMLYANQEFRI